MLSDENKTQSILVGKGSVIGASYIQPELPKFAGNPLIEALPPINTRDTAINAMLRLLTYDYNPRKMPAHLRLHLVMDLLHFFQPLPVHLKLEGMISRMIRDGYLSRNPLDPTFFGTLKERLECLKDGRPLPSGFEPTAAGFSIIGMSGVGKSTALKKVLSLYPQVIIHNHYAGRDFTQVQVVWLKLECPQDGSTRGLCLSFFRAFDDLLGTNYYKNYEGRGHIADELIIHMARVASNHHLGVLVIDEINNLSEAKSGGAKRMLNFFVQLINEISLPVVLVGNPKAIPILSGEFRQARRSSGQGDLVWDRMPFPEEGERDSDWKVFVDALWALQFVKKRCRLTPELSRALYDVSYGITDLAIRIYMAAQWRAIETRAEVISEGLIRSAYRDDFRLMNRILETLKSGNIDPAHLYEDVQLPAVESVHSNDDLDNTEEDGLRPPTAPPDSGDKNNADTSLASDKTKRSTRSKKPGRPVYEPGDLRGVVPRTGKTEPPPDAYQALLRAGYIRSSIEFAQGGVFV